MAAVLFLLLLIGCSCAGFCLFALSQPRNWALLLPNIPYTATYAVRLRAGGWALLATGLCIAIARDGTAFGAMLWVLGLTVGAAIITAFLSMRRR